MIRWALWACVGALCAACAVDEVGEPPPDDALYFPVGIAAHPDGCAYRARMIHALDAAVIRWRVSYTGLGISGLQNAVLNGLGISALTRHTLLPGMRMLGAADGLPPLDDIRVGLFYKHSRLSSAGIGLVNQITGRLDAAGASGDPTRTLGELRIA